MAVSYKEMDGSPKVSISLAELEITRDLKVAWADAYTLVKELLGKADTVYTSAYCSKCSIKNLPGVVSAAGDLCAYSFAVVEAVYSTSVDVQVSESFEPSGEFITVDSTDYTWGSASGEPIVEFPNGKLSTTMDYTMTWKNLAYVPSGALLLQGCVNSGLLNPYLVNSRLVNYVFPAQTLLFHPPLIDRTFNVVSGLQTYDIVYRFTYRPNWQSGVAKGWNYVWNSKTGLYEGVWSLSKSALIPIYPVEPFAFLW